MNKKTVPFNEEQIRSIIAKYPTPFHIYDEKAIVDTVRKLIKAFDWAYDLQEYFAVKATPNPYIMRLLQKEGVGADCSSMAELELCDKSASKATTSSFRPTIRLMLNLNGLWNWAPWSISTIFL